MEEREQYCKHRPAPLAAARAPQSVLSAGFSDPYLGSHLGSKEAVLRSLPYRILLASATLCLFCAGTVHLGAQLGSVPAQRGGRPNDATDGAAFGGGVSDFEAKKLEEARRRVQAVERQKRIVDDTNRLVALATQYNQHIHENGKLTTEDARLLQDIQKLAQSVKDRMRGL